MENFRLPSLYFSDLRLTLATSGLLFSIAGVIGGGYFAKEYADYIKRIFDQFQLPHIAAGHGLFFIGIFTAMALIFLMITVFHNRARKCKYGFIVVGVMFGLTILLGSWTSIRFMQDSIPTTVDIMIENIKNYERNENSTRLIDIIQKELSCCGIYNYTDWSHNDKFECASHVTPLKCGIPKSCCNNNSTGDNDLFCGYESMMMKLGISQNRVWPTVTMSYSDIMFTEGCLFKILKISSSSSMKMAFYFGIVFFSEVLGLICAAKLSYDFNKIHIRANSNDDVDLPVRFINRRGRNRYFENVDLESYRNFRRRSTDEMDFVTDPQSNDLNPIELNPETGSVRESSGMIQSHSTNCSRSGEVFPTSEIWKTTFENELNESDSSQHSNTDNVTAEEFVTDPQPNESNPILEPDTETDFDRESPCIHLCSKFGLSSGKMFPTSKNMVTFEDELGKEETGTQQFKSDDLTKSLIHPPPMVDPDEFAEQEFATESQSTELNPISDPNPETGLDRGSSCMIRSDTASVSRSGLKLSAYENWATFEKEFREEDDIEKFKPDDITESLIRHSPMGYSYSFEEADVETTEL